MHGGDMAGAVSQGAMNLLLALIHPAFLRLNLQKDWRELVAIFASQEA